MAWTTPLTAVANATFTAAQYNTHARANFLEMEPAKATATKSGTFANCMFHATGTNAIAERGFKSAIVQKTGTGQTTDSTSYDDLYTTGPSVQITTGTQALVLFGCLIGNQTANSAAYASVEVSGASTVAADDDWCIELDGHSAASGNDQSVRRSQWKLFTGLTAGSNTFTMKYKAGSNTAQFNYRHLMVWAM
jgi:hypothetical protein